MMYMLPFVSRNMARRGQGQLHAAMICCWLGSDPPTSTPQILISHRDPGATTADCGRRISRLQTLDQFLSTAASFLQRFILSTDFQPCSGGCQLFIPGIAWRFAPTCPEHSSWNLLIALSSRLTQDLVLVTGPSFVAFPDSLSPLPKSSTGCLSDDPSSASRWLPKLSPLFKPLTLTTHIGFRLLSLHHIPTTTNPAFHG
ncbi:hypothetical protein NX059_004595 [Plenodomus lindquistii]|nr:hypothetical protein NX059_004595 [Plenodomus lindquistii]